METFFRYENYFYVVAVIIALSFWLKFSRDSFVSAVEFIKSAFTETSGKTSYSRILGTIVTFKILSTVGEPSDAVMNMFMIFVGYQLIAGILKDNPLIMEYIKMKMQPTKSTDAV